MTHVKLPNSLILQLSSGPVTITPFTIDYHRILDAVINGAPESAIVDLLNPTLVDDMVYYLFDRNGRGEIISASCIGDSSTGTLIGAFASIDHIESLFPELFL